MGYTGICIGNELSALSTFSLFFKFHGGWDRLLIRIANALELPADELLVDNLVATNSKRDGDEYYILLDCTQEEATILIKNMKSLKEILRKYSIR